MYEDNKGQINLDPESGTFEKRTLYIFRIKVRLNLNRSMKVLLIVSWYKSLLVSEW